MFLNEWVKVIQLTGQVCVGKVVRDNSGGCQHLHLQQTDGIEIGIKQDDILSVVVVRDEDDIWEWQLELNDSITCNALVSLSTEVNKVFVAACELDSNEDYGDLMDRLFTEVKKRGIENHRAAVDEVSRY